MLNLSGGRLKFFHRIYTILEYFVSQYAPKLFSFALSWFVVNYFSAVLWGEYIGYSIYVNIILVLLSFGHTEYTLREFAKAPKEIANIWNSSIQSRGYMLLLLIPICFLIPVHQTIRFGLVLWFLGEFVGQSYKSYVIFEKKFKVLVFVEIVGALFFSVLIYFNYLEFSLEYLILFKGLSSVVKATLLSIVFRGALFPKKLVFIKWNYYRGSYFFFLLSVIGLITSNLDLYVVNHFLESDQLGEYQILASFLVLIHAGARQILGPFIKNTYRMKYSTVRKVSRTVALLGLIIVPAGLLVAYFLLFYSFNISFPVHYWFFAGFYTYSSYVGSAHVYWLFQLKLESKILKWNILIVLANLVF
ncbi:MAG: hypothetical protein AAFO69_15895, partial [Bacteroidota bacterium]